MKYTKEPRELGDWYEVEPHWTYIATLIVIVLGLIILVAEYSGVADHIINSFE